MQDTHGTTKRTFRLHACTNQERISLRGTSDSDAKATFQTFEELALQRELVRRQPQLNSSGDFVASPAFGYTKSRQSSWLEEEPSYIRVEDSSLGMGYACAEFRGVFADQDRRSGREGDPRLRECDLWLLLNLHDGFLPRTALHYMELLHVLTR